VRVAVTFRGTSWEKDEEGIVMVAVALATPLYCPETVMDPIPTMAEGLYIERRVMLMACPAVWYCRFEAVNCPPSTEQVAVGFVALLQRGAPKNALEITV
jgi:hypothetical protein